jgi:hypothetical protein
MRLSATARAPGVLDSVVDTGGPRRACLQTSAKGTHRSRQRRVTRLFGQRGFPLPGTRKAWLTIEQRTEYFQNSLARQNQRTQRVNEFDACDIG